MKRGIHCADVTSGCDKWRTTMIVWCGHVSENGANKEIPFKFFFSPPPPPRGF